MCDVFYISPKDTWRFFHVPELVVGSCFSQNVKTDVNTSVRYFYEFTFIENTESKEWVKKIFDDKENPVYETPCLRNRVRKQSFKMVPEKEVGVSFYFLFSSFKSKHSFKLY